MNSQTKQRYISTSIWSDDWFDGLSEREKLVYFYLLTNEHTNAAGVYPCTLKNIRLEIGLTREDIEKIMAKFAEAGKAFYYREYIIIPKWLKHQKISERNKIFIGAISALKALPDEIKDFISDRKHYDFDIQKYVKISQNDGLSMAYAENDAKKAWPIEKTDEKSDRPSKKGHGLSMAYAENDDFSPHDSDLDLDSDSDLDPEFNKNINPVVVVGLGPPPFLENSGTSLQTTTTKFSHIQEIAQSQGFFLSSKQAEGFLTLNPNWLSGSFTFVEFAAVKIRQDTEKSKGDQERIFAKAWSYQNLIGEYASWRSKQEKNAAEKKSELELERAKANIPNQCPNCGGDLKQKRCEACNGALVFDKNNLVYTLEIMSTDNLVEGFKRVLREKYKEEPPPQKEDEIDF